MIFLYLSVHVVVHIASRPLSPRVYDWNRRARWVPMPWYVSPKPGSCRAWIELPRPRLHQFGAWVVSAFFLLSLRSFVTALIVAIVVYWFDQYL